MSVEASIIGLVLAGVGGILLSLSTTINFWFNGNIDFIPESILTFFFKIFNICSCFKRSKKTSEREYNE